MTLICIVDFRPCGKKNKISLGFAGRFTYAELLSVSISILVVWVWIMTGNAKTIMKPSQVFLAAAFFNKYVLKVGQKCVANEGSSIYILYLVPASYNQCRSIAYNGPLILNSK